MIFRKNYLYIYTDGSSFSKPRRGGIGIMYVFLDENEEEQRISGYFSGHEGATNNQMELKAVIEGLKGIPQQEIPIKYNYIEIRTDSKYVVDNKYRAIFTWSKNKWLNQNGKPVENAPLWKEFIKVLTKIHCRVELVWIKGHSKDKDNKAADRLAKTSAKSLLKKPIFTVKIRRKKSENITKIGSVEMTGQRVSVHIITEEFLNLQKLSKYRYEVISKRSAFYQKVDIAFSEIHHLKAGHNYYVQFNKEKDNPRIMKLIKEIQILKNNHI